DLGAALFAGLGVHSRHFFAQRVGDVLGNVAHLTVRGEAEAHDLAAVARLLEREPEPVPVAFDADDPQRQDVADVDRLTRVRDTTVDQLAHVDKALHGPFQASEGAKGHELCDHAGHDVVDVVAVDDAVPMGGLGAADAQGNLLGFGIDLHYVNVDVVADL